MRYELLIISDEPSFPSPESLLAAVGARGLSSVTAPARGGFDDPAASPRLLLEESGGARLLLAFERADFARAVAASLAGAPAALAERLSEADRETLRRAAAAYRLQISVPGDSPGNAVRLVVQVADALVERGGAVVLDPQMMTLFGAERWKADAAHGEADVRRHLVVHAEATGAGVWLHTHGLVKFGRPELELVGVPEVLVDAATRLLDHAARHLAGGGVLRVGDGLEVPGGAHVRIDAGGDQGGDLDDEVLRLSGEGGGAPVAALRAVG